MPSGTEFKSFESVSPPNSGDWRVSGLSRQQSSGSRRDTSTSSRETFSPKIHVSNANSNHGLSSASSHHHTPVIPSHETRRATSSCTYSDPEAPYSVKLIITIEVVRESFVHLHTHNNYQRSSSAEELEDGEWNAVLKKDFREVLSHLGSSMDGIHHDCDNTDPAAPHEFASPTSGYSSNRRSTEKGKSPKRTVKFDPAIENDPKPDEPGSREDDSINPLSLEELTDLLSRFEAEVLDCKERAERDCALIDEQNDIIDQQSDRIRDLEELLDEKEGMMEQKDNQIHEVESEFKRIRGHLEIFFKNALGGGNGGHDGFEAGENVEAGTRFNGGTDKMVMSENPIEGNHEDRDNDRDEIRDLEQFDSGSYTSSPQLSDLPAEGSLSEHDGDQEGQGAAVSSPISDKASHDFQAGEKDESGRSLSPQSSLSYPSAEGKRHRRLSVVSRPKFHPDIDLQTPTLSRRPSLNQHQEDQSMEDTFEPDPETLLSRQGPLDRAMIGRSIMASAPQRHPSFQSSPSRSPRAHPHRSLHQQPGKSSLGSPLTSLSHHQRHQLNESSMKGESNPFEEEAEDSEHAEPEPEEPHALPSDSEASHQASETQADEEGETESHASQSDVEQHLSDRSPSPEQSPSLPATISPLSPPLPKPAYTRRRSISTSSSTRPNLRSSSRPNIRASQSRPNLRSPEFTSRLSRPALRTAQSQRNLRSTSRPPNEKQAVKGTNDDASRGLSASEALTAPALLKWQHGSAESSGVAGGDGGGSIKRPGNGKTPISSSTSSRISGSNHPTSLVKPSPPRGRRITVSFAPTPAPINTSTSGSSFQKPPNHTASSIPSKLSHHAPSSSSSSSLTKRPSPPSPPSQTNSRTSPQSQPQTTVTHPIILVSCDIRGTRLFPAHPSIASEALVLIQAYEARLRTTSSWSTHHGSNHVGSHTLGQGRRKTLGGGNNAAFTPLSASSSSYPTTVPGPYAHHGGSNSSSGGFTGLGGAAAPLAKGEKGDINCLRALLTHPFQKSHWRFPTSPGAFACKTCTVGRRPCVVIVNSSTPSGLGGFGGSSGGGGGVGRDGSAGSGGGVGGGGGPGGAGGYRIESLIPKLRKAVQPGERAFCVWEGRGDLSGEWAS